MEKKMTPQDYADSLRKKAAQTHDISEFAKSVVHQLMRDAAESFEKGKIKDNVAEVNLKFRIKPVPRPGEINICWEISNGLYDYIECSSPSTPPIRIDPCISLRRSMDEATTNLQRMRILMQMLAQGCITLPSALRDVQLFINDN